LGVKTKVNHTLKMLIGVEACQYSNLEGEGKIVGGEREPNENLSSLSLSEQKFYLKALGAYTGALEGPTKITGSE
jgi:hypothetical protein